MFPETDLLCKIVCVLLVTGAGERQQTEVGEKRIATGGFTLPVISTERELGEW